MAISKTIIATATGLVVNKVELPDNWTGVEGEWPVPDGHYALSGDDGEIGDTWNGTKYIKRVMPAIPYDVARADAYASIGDQLDMQYHDLVNGTTTWKDHVAKVKTDNAKPE